MAGETLLVISGEGMPPYAVRGITQSLEPIAATQFDKYKSTISGEDVDPPAFDRLQVGNWRRTVNGGLVDLSGRGSTVTVDCAFELSYKDGGSPQRTVVPGSQRLADGYWFYRPRLTMGVVNKSQETREFEATTSWLLELEEI